MLLTYLLIKDHVILWLLHVLCGFYGKSQGETMNVRGCTTGEMWIDLLGLTNPTRRLGAGRGHIVSNYLEPPMMTVVPTYWAYISRIRGSVMVSNS